MRVQIGQRPHFLPGLHVAGAPLHTLQILFVLQLRL